MESETNSSQMQDSTEERFADLISRLKSVVELLERAMARPELAASAPEAVGPIVAMVEAGGRETELAGRLAEAEKTIAQLRASSASREGRRTLPVSLLAKQDGAAPEAGILDAALMSLSLEQRIAVKAHLLRSGAM